MSNYPGPFPDSDEDGRPETPAPTRWRVRLESRPWIDGGRVPLPAVWVVRNPNERAVYATSNPRWARLVADARARNHPDPILDEDEPATLTPANPKGRDIG